MEEVGLGKEEEALKLALGGADLGVEERDGDRQGKRGERRPWSGVTKLGGEFLKKRAQSAANCQCVLADLHWLPKGSGSLGKFKGRNLQGPVIEGRCPAPAPCGSFGTERGSGPWGEKGIGRELQAE